MQLLVFLLPLAAGTQAPASAAVDLDKLFQPVVERLKGSEQKIAELSTQMPEAEARAAVNQAMRDEVGQLTPFLQPFLTEQLKKERYGFALSELEESRWNKQTGSGAAAAGTTSVVSKGSIPALFGFAVENGALTRTASGTTITFRGSPANFYSALAHGGYIPAGAAVPEWDGSFLAIAKRVSFHVAFDASRGNTGDSGTAVFTGDRQQLAGWGIRTEVVNKRDPRRGEYERAWSELMDREGLTFINDFNALMSVIEPNAKFQAWRTKLQNKIATAREEQFLGILKDAFPEFAQVAGEIAASNALFDATLRRAAASGASFAMTRRTRINSIMKSWTAAVEYNVVKQGSASGATPPQLPDLGNLNVVLSRGFVDGPELTVNVGTTWFQSIPAGVETRTLRDIQTSFQLDFPLREIQQIGKPTLTVAGQFVSLRAEPLGAKVLVNGVAVSTKGNIGLVQAKLTIPTRSAGVSIPLSVTWANRTELIKERQVRANFGISWDLDKIFARPQ